MPMLPGAAAIPVTHYRTAYDQAQMKKSCSCTQHHRSSSGKGVRPSMEMYRSLAFDDPYNPASYRLQYRHL